MKEDWTKRPIDWDAKPDPEALEILERGLYDTGGDLGNDSLIDWDLVEQNIALTRNWIMKRGIPGLLLYNGAKALAVGAGTYLVYPGDTETKVVAAGVASAGLLSVSPTFWTAGALIAAKIGKKVFNSFSPKP